MPVLIGKSGIWPGGLAFLTSSPVMLLLLLILKPSLSREDLEDTPESHLRVMVPYNEGGGSTLKLPTYLTGTVLAGNQDKDKEEGFTESWKRFLWPFKAFLFLVPFFPTTILPWPWPGWC